MASHTITGKIAYSGTTIFLLMGLLLSGCSQTSETPTSSPVPTSTQIPTETSSPLPDLIVKSVSIDLGSGDQCDDTTFRLGIRVKIENLGEAAAGPFVVDVNGTQKYVASGLDPGKVVYLRFPNFQEQTEVWVDSAAQVEESSEDNNKSSERLITPTLSPRCLQTPSSTTASVLEPAAILEGHTAKVWSIDFAPDGNLLASGSVDNTMRLWLVKDAALLRTMQGHPFPIYTLAFSADGTALATGSSDGLIRLWRVSDGRLDAVLEGHAGWLKDLDFSPDGKRLASISEDFTVRIWRLADNRLIKTIDEGMSSINDITYSPDSNYLAWAEEDGSLRLWDTQNSAWLYILHSTQPARSIAFSPDGNLLAAGYADGTIRIWRLDNGEQMFTMHDHSDSVSCLAFSPDGQWLVSGSVDQTLRLWRAQIEDLEFSLEYKLAGHASPVHSVAFSPDGVLIASGSDDHNILLWAVPDY